MRFVAWGNSETGARRQHSEDRIAVDPDHGFFMVADGMGNGRNGAIAAQTAIDVVYARVRALLGDRVREVEPVEGRDRLQSQLPPLMSEASEAIFHRAKSDQACHGMATTATVLQVIGSIGVVGHIGDARVYLIRGGQAYQLTEDHTLVQEMLRSGTLAPEAVASFPHRNVLSRALGKAPNAEIDTVVVDAVPGDRFLLCSDGLTDHVQAPELVAVTTTQPPNAAVPTLASMARERGGGDDISIIVVEVHGEAVRPTTIPTQEKAGLLGQIFLCKDLTFQEIVRVLAVVQERRVSAGTTVIREGEPDDFIYLLAVGSAQVSRHGIVRRQLVVGDHFGELALIGSGHHTITVTTTSDSVLLTLRKDDLYNLVRSDHGIAIKLLWGFLKRLGDTVEEQAAEITRLRSGG